MNKDRPRMSATKLQLTKCTFHHCIDYVTLIAQGVPALWGAKQVWDGKNELFSSEMR